ncbi:MAG: hypothetical protein GXO10_02720 [Crenarchaeota archaeon]|nr:hypothetical protein [Thermoproteota archaeon]
MIGIDVERTLNIALCVALLVLLLLEFVTGSCYYYIISINCMSSTRVSVPVILTDVGIDCRNYSVKISPKSNILVSSLMITTCITGLLCERRRDYYSSSIFSTFSRIMNYVALILLLPLPLYLNLGVVSLVVLLSNPLLSACIFSMKIPAEILCKYIREEERMTEVYISIDELMDDTLTLEESEYEE